MLNSNSIAFIGLCKEYCTSLENCRTAERDDFINSMLHLLPRLYIVATDLKVDLPDEEDAYIDSALDEDYYDSIRRNVETLMGPDDTYLEVFEEDMKFSDTPVTASVSECLADIFQVLFNFLAAVREATDFTVDVALMSVRDDFRSYWSTTLCNVLRALNSIAYR